MIRDKYYYEACEHAKEFCIKLDIQLTDEQVEAIAAKSREKGEAYGDKGT